MRSQLETTPPYSGADMVADANEALQSIATNFAGPTDPAAMAWPYATWADTGNMLLKRRNAANTDWVSEGALLSGLKGIASTLEAQALTADDVVITPKKLADAFGGANQSLSTNGYQKLPGGLIIQWGVSESTNLSGTTLVTLPIAFPNMQIATVITPSVASHPRTAVREFHDQVSFGFSIWNLQGARINNAATWVSIGY